MKKEKEDTGLQVIGAGFGRSGTMSLQKAIEILGYSPCYHMQVALYRYHHLRFWIRATAGKKVDFVRFFRKYKATVDWPACEFFPELMRAFPKAKVILNIRDPEAWYDSMFKTIWAIQPLYKRSFPRAYKKIHDDLMWNSRFQGQFENREKAISIYKDYIEEVKQAVPEEKLLVYNVKQGWEPLCEFLGAAVPVMPFPYLNDSSWFQRFLKRLKILEWVIPILVILAILVFIGVLVS